MEDRSRFLATRRTDEELYERLNNREKYLPETVEASLEELKSRGESFSDELLKVIAEDMEARRHQAASPTGYDSLFNNSDKLKQVEDPDAPAFYSKRAIYAFCILFSVLFGSIMFAMNVDKSVKKINIIWVILYGIAFTAAEYILAQSLRMNFGIAFILGIAGAYPLNYFMWQSFLGKATLYRVRPIWVPLIVGVAISALVLWSMLQTV
jgi:hypothetical protein